MHNNCIIYNTTNTVITALGLYLQVCATEQWNISWLAKTLVILDNY